MFRNYNLSEDILKALDLLGYKEPTNIQKEVIPAILDGKHVVAKAPTGSGKTAAFAIPICEKVIWEENAPQALILEPTRELTVQVSEETFNIARKKRLKVPAVFGGFPIYKQIQTLRQRAHIVVGTPGRVMDLIRRGKLKLDKISYLVIDEADQMLDMGFIDEVKKIIELIPSKFNISLFSATLRPEIEQIVEKYIKDSVKIMQEPDEKQSIAITQKIYDVNMENKYETLIDILISENPENCMIFCGTRVMVNTLCQKLKRNRISCKMLHGDMEQRERLKTVDAFKRGVFRFLIATDVASRGVHFENITHVINYDFPTSRETYIHRIGRTGRNGKTGTAISLVCKSERRKLKAVESYIGQKLPILKRPVNDEQTQKEFWKKHRGNAEIKPKKGAALQQGIMRLAIGGGRKSKMRAGDIVGAICNIEGVEIEDIGIIDIRDSISHVEILNNKGVRVRKYLQAKPIKGKIRNVK